MADPEKIIKVSVVTPDGIVYSHNATMVAMRAIDGDRAIMYDHLPIVTPLSIGEVRVKRTHEMNDRIDHIAVNGGYIEFSNNEATIIADSAERARNIDVKRAQSAKKRAELSKICCKRNGGNEIPSTARSLPCGRPCAVPAEDA